MQIAALLEATARTAGIETDPELALNHRTNGHYVLRVNHAHVQVAALLEATARTAGTETDPQLGPLSEQLAALTAQVTHTHTHTHTHAHTRPMLLGIDNHVCYKISWPLIY